MHSVSVMPTPKSLKTLMGENMVKKPIYLKAETECIDDAGMTVKLPKYTQFVIKNIIVENGSQSVTLDLTATDGKLYRIKTTFVHASVTNLALRNDGYFADVFGIGDCVPNIPIRPKKPGI